MTRFATRLIVAAALAMASTPILAESAADDVRQGDGRVSGFYRWEDKIPTKPGALLRRESLPSVVGLKNAGRQERILYTSTDGVTGAGAIAVSGALFVPSGTPPPGGWPLVSWGHGTVGVADICAPSWQGRSYRDVRYLNRWLAEGFAVVATDYQGLGTVGGHPLLNNRAAAFGILDAARAALAADKTISNRVFIVGQSQGGAGAFAAAGFAPDYAPEVKVLGTVATGVIYSPPGAKRGEDKNLDVVDETIAYSFYSILSAIQHDPSIDPAAVFTEGALPLVDQARATCLFPLEADVVGLGLTRRKALRPEGAAITGRWFGSVVRYPTFKLSAPIFIGAGATDGSTTANTQMAIARAACAAGSVVEARVYAGQDHSGTVNQSLTDSIPFVRHLLRGEAVASNCSALPGPDPS